MGIVGDWLQAIDLCPCDVSATRGEYMAREALLCGAKIRAVADSEKTSVDEVLVLRSQASKILILTSRRGEGNCLADSTESLSGAAALDNSQADRADPGTTVVLDKLELLEAPCMAPPGYSPGLARAIMFEEEHRRNIAPGLA